MLGAGTTSINLSIECSFCGKYRSEVSVMMAGAKGYICDECIEHCAEVIAEHKAQQRLGQKRVGSARGSADARLSAPS